VKCTGLEEATLTEDIVVEMRLYVAGQSPNSSRAQSNLSKFCEANLPDRYRLEVVDVHREPERALQDGVMLTPTLLVLTHDPPARLVGSLSEVSVLTELLLIP